MGLMRKKANWIENAGTFFWALLSAFAFWACSTSETTALGNSAESGNPEIAGVLRFSSGEPAAKVRVTLVPAEYSALSGEMLDSSWMEKTDSLGRYSFDRVPDGAFSLEALDSASGKMFLKQGIGAKDSTLVEVDGVLENTGCVRLGAHGFKDGTTGFVTVPGTTILRAVTVEMGNIFVDSLPADSLSPIVFVSDDGYSLSLKEGVLVVADSVVNVDAERVSFGFKFLLDAAEIGVSENLLNFPLKLSLDSSDYDFSGLERVQGVWSAVFCGDTLSLDLSYSDVRAGKFTFWTRIPKLRSGVDTLFLYFTEKDSAQSKNSDVSVFADSYIAAWHFDEGADSVWDATGNSFVGEPKNMTVADEAVAGSALYYDGKNSSVRIPNSADDDFNVTVKDPITFSVWVKMEDLEKSRVVFGKGASQYHLSYLKGTESLWLYEAFSDEILGQDSTTASTRYWYCDSTAEAGVWTFLTVVQDTGKTVMYVNDSLIVSEARVGTSTKSRIADSLFVIGELVYPADSATNTVTHRFKGIIDELHVSRVPRSSDWVKASYANQNPERRWPEPIALP